MSSCSPGAMRRPFDLNGADPRMETLCSGYAQTVPRGVLVLPVAAPVPPHLSLVFCILRLRGASRPGDRGRSSGSATRAAFWRQLDVQVGTGLCPEVVDVDGAAGEARARCPHRDCQPDVLVVRGQGVRLRSEEHTSG